MKILLSLLKYLILTTLIIVTVLMIYLRWNYGGGKVYPDISTQPTYGQEDLELFYSHEEPIGNVAATSDTSREVRVFFTIHPESRPLKTKLMEIRGGKAFPYPDEATQEHFTTVLGLFCDQQNRLWSIDHGNHGSAPVKLTAFDLSTNKIIHEYDFPRDVAETLSFFNDLSITPDGRYAFVADVSFFGRKPSLVVYDIDTRRSRSLLDNHESVYHQNFVPVTPQKKMRFFGGIVDLLTGIDGLDISLDGQYIYYAAMGHSGLYRIPVSVAVDFDQPVEKIENAVERVSDKPLSDGIRCDHVGNVYITDIENTGIYVVEPSGKGYTLIKDERIRWADGLSLGGDHYFYLADSDIPNQMLQSKRHMKAHAPYHIFRFRPLGNL